MTVNRHKSLTPLLPLPALLALTLTLSGCGGGGSNGAASTSSTASPMPAPAPAPAPLSASSTLSDGLTATLEENTTTVPVGGSVTYTLTLTNNTNQPITYQAEFGSASIGAGSATSVGGVLQIVNASGQAVFPVPGQGTTSPSIVVPVSPVALAPGQSTSGTAAVGGVFTAGGRYAATAQFILQPTPGGPTQSTTVGPLTVTVQ